MRICSIRHISVECSLPVLLIIPLAGIFEMLDILLMAFIALSAHELCHAYMARSFGVGVIKLRYSHLALSQGSRKTPFCRFMPS